MTQVVDSVRAFVPGHPVGSEAWAAVAWSLAIVVVFTRIAVAAYGCTSAR